MDEESTKGKALADMAGSLLTPCYHLGDDDSDGYYRVFFLTGPPLNIVLAGK